MKRKPEAAVLAQDEDAVRPGPGDISVHSSTDCFSTVCSPSLRSWGHPLRVRAAVKNHVSLQKSISNTFAGAARRQRCFLLLMYVWLQ